MLKLTTNKSLKIANKYFEYFSQTKIYYFLIFIAEKSPADKSLIKRKEEIILFNQTAIIFDEIILRIRMMARC